MTFDQFVLSLPPYTGQLPPWYEEAKKRGELPRLVPLSTPPPEFKGTPVRLNGQPLTRTEIWEPFRRADYCFDAATMSQRQFMTKWNPDAL